MKFERGGVAVTFDATLYPSKFQTSRHQVAGISEDEQVLVYDRAKEQLITLQFKHRDPAEIDAVRRFFEDVVKMSLYTFTFTPEPDQDAGAGDGVAVTVRYWSSNLTERQQVYQRYMYPEIILRVENEI